MITIDTQVVSIDSLTENVLKVLLDTSQVVSFKAGQYLQVVMSENDKRPFSIANMPNNDGLIELHIGATPSNPYAYEVVELAKTSKRLSVEIGIGEAFRRDSNLPAILIAGGTGYSYTKSILLDSLHVQPSRPIYLYWGGKTYEDLYEAKDLMALSTVNKNFVFVPVVEHASTDWEGKTGLVHKAVMQDFESFANTQVYVAGRFEMAAVIREELTPKGLSKDALFGDAFAFI